MSAEWSERFETGEINNIENLWLDPQTLEEISSVVESVDSLLRA